MSGVGTETYGMDEEREVEEFEEEDEEEDLSEDLGQRKQKINEFNVEGNQALNQTNIQTLNLKVNYIAKTENKQEKSKYDLQKKEDCNKFVESFGKGEYLATAIILSVFEAITIEDFPWLMESLMEFLPNSKNSEKRENEYREQLDSYVALDSILQVIGAQKLITDEGQVCIGLGINNAKPLGNIWEQFLRLREGIVSWLLHLVEIQKCNTIFEAYQIVTAFTKVILIDSRTAEKYIFPQLYSNSGNVWLLGNLLFKLYGKDEKKEYWNALIIKWACSRSEWLWKSAYLAYALFIEHDVTIKSEKRLKEILSERICLLRKKDINFILSTLFLSAKVRTMFCEILNMAYMKVEDKEKVILKYLAILRNGFYRVRPSRIEIPLLICDTAEQQNYLKNTISFIMERNSLRKQLFRILKPYVEEITNYRYSEKNVRYLSAYFYNMSLDGKDNVKEIIYFLKECECELAKDVYICFWNTYQKREKVLLT